MKKLISILILFCSHTMHGQEYRFKRIEINTASSFRGLSVIDDKVAWVSGSKGWIGITTDGAVTWNFNQVKGFEDSDFRSLYAFDSQHAIIANAGSPANILSTKDGGKNWKSVYTNSHQDAFFDGIDFWNEKEGIIYGDPIEGKMLLLQTKDGGATWTEIKQPPHLEKGEASFAASGTGIRCTHKKDVTIATGGVVSRLWFSKDKGEHWSSIATPIIQGESTTGIFSFVQNSDILTIVGGDFKKEDLNTNHNFYSLDEGKTWLVPAVLIRGYRECVEPVAKKILIATGPSGTDISYDNGIQWQALSDGKGLHVFRKARRGTLCIAAGGKGQVFLVGE